MCFPTRCKAIICAMSLAVLPVLAACGFEDAFFAEKDPPEKTASAQELSPYWLRDLNHNGVTVAKPRTVSPGLWADRPQVAYSNETLFARPVSRGTSLADAGEAGLVPISALRPGEDPSATLPPPAEEGSPPPAVISASYQSPDLAQSAALVTDQLGPSFADSSQAQVVLPVAAAPQPGRQLHLGFQPVHRVQTAAKAKTVRRAPPAPVIATPVGRDALSSDTTTPAVVADAPETAPPAPPVPRTPVVAAALEDDTDSGAVSGWTAPDSVEEVDVASSASAADSEEALAAPKSPKAKTPTDSYRLQLASLRDRSSASNEGVRLKSRFGELLGDKDLVLESADLGSRGVFHRVQLGPFGSRDHASLTCSDLKALGQDCLVVVR